MAAFRSTLRSIGAVETGIPADPGLEPLDTARKRSWIRRLGHLMSRPGRTIVTVAKTLPSRLLPGRVSHSVRTALATMFGVLVVGIAAYALLGGPNVWNSLYFMLLTAVGEANPDPTLSGIQQILQTIVTFTGVAMIPVVSAAIVQASVPAFGRDRVTERNHVVVVGLGNVGTRVLRALHEQGYPVVAIDHTENPYGAQYVRERHIHFIVGDESRESTLRRANVAHAAALLVLTSEDVVNLEYALQGRQLQPNLRVVLRLFDGDFADRVNDVFNVTISASVSNLAASNFAAAMVGREVIGTIPVGRRVLLVADVPVIEGSGLAGRTLASIDETGRARVIAIADSDGQLTVPPVADRTLAVGERVVVVATRIGLSQIVAASAPILGPPPPPDPVGAGRM